MKKIIKNKPASYQIKCTHCDCEFTYELEDIYIDVKAVVRCPECYSILLHSNRQPEPPYCTILEITQEDYNHLVATDNINKTTIYKIKE